MPPVAQDNIVIRQEVYRPPESHIEMHDMSILQSTAVLYLTVLYKVWLRNCTASSPTYYMSIRLPARFAQAITTAGTD